MWVEKGDVCPMEYLIIFVGAVAATILIFDLMNAAVLRSRHSDASAPRRRERGQPHPRGN